MRWPVRASWWPTRCTRLGWRTEPRCVGGMAWTARTAHSAPDMASQAGIEEVSPPMDCAGRRATEGSLGWRASWVARGPGAQRIQPCCWAGSHAARLRQAAGPGWGRYRPHLEILGTQHNAVQAVRQVEGARDSGISWVINLRRHVHLCVCVCVCLEIGGHRATGGSPLSGECTEHAACSQTLASR